MGVVSGGPTVVGRIVHVVLDSKECRGAIITRVWGPDLVNLTVFTDGANDGLRDVERITSAPYEEDQNNPRKWHWSAECKDQK